MTDANLFDQGKQDEPTPQEPTPQTPPESEYLSQLVGEGRKFKTPEELARGKFEADQFIEQLKREQEQLREELEKRTGLEEKLDSLLKAQQEGRQPEPPATPDQGKQVDELNIEQLIEGHLSKREQEQRAQSNMARSQQSVVDHFGGDAAKAKEYIAQRAKELGVTTEYLGQRATESPQAFLALGGIQSQRKDQRTDTKPQGTTTDVPSNYQGPQPGSMAYFDEMRRKDPNRYYSPAVQREVYKAARENPNDWR